MKEIKDILKEVSDKIRDEESFFFSVYFKYNTDVLSSFLKEFESYGFKNVENLIFMSKKLDGNEAVDFEKKFKDFSIKMYKVIPIEDKDFFNKSIDNYKSNSMFAEKIKEELRSDKIEQIKKIIDYEKNLNEYNKKLLDKEFSKKYLKEITKFIKSVLDVSEFERCNNQRIEDTIKDIYFITKRMADKNVFDFAPLANYSTAIGSTLYNVYNRVTLDKKISIDSQLALSNNDSIEIRGLYLEKLYDIIKIKYKDTDKIKANKFEHEISKLEDDLIYRYIPTDNLMKGFTFSKGRYQYTNENPFMTMLKEVARAAINEVKVKRSHELFNTLKSNSENMTGKDINEYLIEFMEEGRFLLRNDWNEQFSIIIKDDKKRKNKIKI